MKLIEQVKKKAACSSVSAVILTAVAIGSTLAATVATPAALEWAEQQKKRVRPPATDKKGDSEQMVLEDTSD